MQGLGTIARLSRTRVSCRRGGYQVRLAQLFELPATWLVGVLAFLAGGVVLNVLREELPERRQSRFWTVALGGPATPPLLRPA